ncbi:MAG: dihydroorotate dehydrogenase, partial [Actinomycetota bacterium]|nr:dihydroorotate dehydrogenase [Actinomycetota bacterium]
MSVTVAGLTLASPVLVASGCGGTGRELSAYAPLRTYGAFVTRSISRDARPGADGPTIAETPAGLV